MKNVQEYLKQLDKEKIKDKYLYAHPQIEYNALRNKSLSKEPDSLFRKIYEKEISNGFTIC